MKKLKLVCNCLIFVWFDFQISSSFGQKKSEIDQTLSKYHNVKNKRIAFNGLVIVANNDGNISQQANGLASKNGVKPEIIFHKNKLLSKLGGNLPIEIYPQDQITFIPRKLKSCFTLK